SQNTPPVAGCGSCPRRRPRPEGRRQACEGKEMTAHFTLRSLAIAATAASLAACAVGPDYHAPVAPAVGIYTERPQPARTEAAPVRGGEAQRVEGGGRVAAGWEAACGSTTRAGRMR